MAKLTKAQRARLDKLATYLEKLPADYEAFHMGDFFGLDPDDEATIRYARRNGGVPACGTVACAVGHGPAAGILVAPRFIRQGGVHWRQYSEQFVSESSDANGPWDWCFGGEWTSCDDGHLGAAGRIRYLLAEGEPPQSFGENGALDCHVALYAPYRIPALLAKSALHDAASLEAISRMSSPNDDRNLLKLAERCEAASGILVGEETKVILWAAFRVLNPQPSRSRVPTQADGSPWPGDGLGPYTAEHKAFWAKHDAFLKKIDAGAFLDAAMGLVPEGCVWLRKSPETMSIYTPPKDEKFWATHIDGKGATPALALVAACLRAMEVKS